MNQRKNIAILLATYNGEQYLRTQIQSIINQTYKNWNLYIRDDGSKDKTVDIIREYCKKYPNIFIIEDSLGCLGCRDQFLHLLSIIDADYYMFCDQDDEWFPDKIEKSYQLIRKIEKTNKETAILIASDSTICGPNLEVINNSCWDHLRINPRTFLTKNGIYVYPFLTGASMIFNKKAKDILPPIPSECPYNRPMYDWWLLINVFKFGIVELLEEPTRFYRQHSSNVSGGLDKLETSYFSKLKKFKSVWKSNKVRADVLRKIGYGSAVKYYFFKMIYLIKLISYKHNK